MIRSPEQKATIEKLGQGQPGKLDVLVSSVEDVKSEGDALKILEQVKPDWVVWSAGRLSFSQFLSPHPVCSTASMIRTSVHSGGLRGFITR